VEGGRRRRRRRRRRGRDTRRGGIRRDVVGCQCQHLVTVMVMSIGERCRN
jgi:hypothetical protein